MKKGQLIDISFPISCKMAIYPNNPPFCLERVLDMENGDSANVSCIAMGSHTGTHIDAPSHFIPGGMSIDEISLEQFNGYARVYDITNHDEIDVVLVSSLSIKRNDIILFRTNNSIEWDCDRILERYVTLTYDAAEYLANVGVKLVGIDYLTIERPRELRIQDKSVHKTLLEKNVLICEGLRLRDVVDGDYQFWCLPLNIRGSDGCPVRTVLTKV